MTWVVLEETDNYDDYTICTSLKRALALKRQLTKYQEVNKVCIFLKIWG